MTPNKKATTANLLNVGRRVAPRYQKSKFQHKKFSLILPKTSYLC